MDISSIMGKQVAELQHTLSMNLLKSQMATLNSSSHGDDEGNAG